MYPWLPSQNEASHQELGWQAVPCTVRPFPAMSSTILWLDSMLVMPLLDSRSSISLAQPMAFPLECCPYGKLLVTCMHGDVHEVPMARVHPDHYLTIGIINDLPVPSLVGPDQQCTNEQPAWEDWPRALHFSPPEAVRMIERTLPQRPAQKVSHPPLLTLSCLFANRLTKRMTRRRTTS